MSARIVDLDANRPHYSIACDCGVHVVPELYLERLADGSDVEPLPDCLLRSIVAGWLDMMRGCAES